MKTIRLTLCSFGLAAAVQAGVLLDEEFNYADGSLTNVSAGKWSNHSGPAGQVLVASQAITLTQSQGEDVNALLAGGPYAKTGGAVLYVAFEATFTALPSSTGTYFAHFKNATTGYNAKIFAATAGAGPGSFRLGISGGASTPALLETDLVLGTAYTIVTRYEIATQAATLWVNPATEADPGVTATDDATANDVVAFALREAAGMGALAVDHLRVATRFSELFGVVDPTPAIVSQPRSLSVAAADPATFTVVATGAGPLGYQWQHCLTNLPNAAAAVLKLDRVSADDAGPYHVRVSNEFGTVTSDAAVLTVTNRLPAGVMTNIGSLHTLQDPVNFQLTDAETVFTIEGTVTTWANLAGASGCRFFVQDDTGGIAVAYAHAAGQTPNAGDRVRITGPLTQDHGLLVIQPDASQPGQEVTVLGGGNELPVPCGTSPTELTTLTAAELESAWEGRLVTLTNLALPPDLTTFPAGKNITVSDADGTPYTLFVNAGTDIGGQAVPAGLIAVVGVVAQVDAAAPYDSGYQILPSRFADILSPAKPPVVRFTNVVEHLVRPGELPTNTFPEMGLRTGEQLTLRIGVTDPLGGTVTVQPDAAGLPPSARWEFVASSGTNVQGSFHFSPTAAEAGQFFAVSLRAWNAGATNATTWEIYVPTAAEQRVAITEFLANPSADLSVPCFNPLRRDPPGDNPGLQDEFLEIANLSPTDLDLTGWTIADAVQVRHNFSDAFTLAAQNALIVYGGPPVGFPPNLAVATFPASEGSAGLALNNAGDTIVLRNALGGIVERLVYGPAMVSAAGSMTRFPTIDDAFAAQPTVGTEPVTPGRQYDGQLWSEPPTIPGTDMGSTSIVCDGTGAVVLSWNAEAGRTHSVWLAPTPGGPWTAIATGLAEGTFTEPLVTGPAARFYRISSP